MNTQMQNRQYRFAILEKDLLAQRVLKIVLQDLGFHEIDVGENFRDLPKNVRFSASFIANDIWQKWRMDEGEIYKLDLGSVIVIKDRAGKKEWKCELHKPILYDTVRGLLSDLDLINKGD